LTLLQRTVLIKILNATRENPLEGLDVATLAMKLREEGTTSDGLVIADTLDHLVDAGHIVADANAMYYRAVDLKGKRPAYEFALDD